MAVDSLFVKSFSKFQGLDLRSSDLTRPEEFSSSLDNASFNATNAIVKRKGYQYKAGNFGGLGLSTYEDINTTTGAVTETLVTLDDDLYTLVEDSFNVTYSGSGTALLNIKVNSAGTAFQLTIVEDTVTLLDQNLKLGIDEASSTAISTVITAIDGLASFAASGGTITTGSAAYLDLHRDTVLTSTATSVSYKRWAAVTSPTSNPLATTLAARNNSDFELPSFTNMNNCLYVNSSYNNMYKYDGQTFYRAGMPAGGDADGSGDAGVAPTLADAAGGTTFAIGDDYFYMFTYVQYDNKGNLIEGIRSPYSAKHTMVGNKDLAVTVTNISSSSGFNTGGAIVNGAQNGITTVTVDSGHTLKSGDTIYFYDGATSAYVTRTLTATTSTTITFASSVNVADNAIISNNLRIAIYRTVQIGSATDASIQTYYLVKEIPNDSIGTSTQLFTDNVTDANLSIQYVEPIKSHGLPPKGKYVTKFRNQLFIAGVPTDVNGVYYSDINQPEYFPASENQFLVDAFFGAKIRGIGALDTALIVFKDKSIQAVTGDISEDAFRVDEISYGGIGCASHNSIQSILGTLFFLSEKGGIFSVNNDGVNEVGRRISTEFTAFDVAYNLQKSTSTHWIDQNKYILFVPEESQDGSDDYANSDSRCYVYDYARDAWLIWSNINAMGGIEYNNDGLYFAAKRLDSSSGNVEVRLAKVSNYGNLQDYYDHNDPVDFSYSTHWEALGNPAQFKRFLRLKVFALSSDVLDGEASLYTLTIDSEFNYQTPAVISSFTMDFSGGADGWGNSEWGNSPWGDAALNELTGKLKSIKSRAIRLTFTNEVGGEDVLISGYELEVVPPFVPKIKE